MQLNSCTKIISHLKPLNLLSADKLDEFIDYLSSYRVNEIIYPEAFIDEEILDKEIAYRVFSELVKLGYLKEQYRFYCNECKIPTKTYPTLECLIAEAKCEHCTNAPTIDGSTLNLIIIVFRVVVE